MGLDSICITGIILFTYHKYRKSIESVVPLDGHGNPIPTVDDLSEGSNGHNGHHVELEESVGLRSFSRAGVDFEVTVLCVLK